MKEPAIFNLLLTWLHKINPQSVNPQSHKSIPHSKNIHIFYLTHKINKKKTAKTSEELDETFTILQKKLVWWVFMEEQIHVTFSYWILSAISLYSSGRINQNVPKPNKILFHRPFIVSASSLSGGTPKLLSGRRKCLLNKSIKRTE